MNACELRQAHHDLFGVEPMVTQTEHLQRKIARKLQVENEGDLPATALDYASAIARETGLRVRFDSNVDRRIRGLPVQHSVAATLSAGCDPRLPMPGSRLVKQFRGRTIVVHVLDDGFEYDDRRYQSLSAVAKEITGTKWNGFLFFGLTKEQSNGCR